jgi:hypothetical protein
MIDRAESPPGFVTAAKLARLAGVTRTHVEQLAARGRIHAIRTPRQTFVTAEDAAEWLAGRKGEIPDDGYTIATLASASGLSRQQIALYVADGRIVSIRNPDGRIEIPAAIAADWLEARHALEDFVSVGELARLAEVNAGTIRRYCASGTIRSVLIGKRLHIARAEADRFLRTRKGIR